MTTHNVRAGQVVKATVPESVEYDDTPKEVVGVLTIRRVESLGGYDQYWVNGYQVDPDTIQVLEG